MNQTYPELSEVVLKEMRNWGKENPSKETIQEYFFQRKNENPEIYERMIFDASRPPVSGTLLNIIFQLKLAKKLDWENNVIPQ